MALAIVSRNSPELQSQRHRDWLLAIVNGAERSVLDACAQPVDRGAMTEIHNRDRRQNDRILRDHSRSVHVKFFNNNQIECRLQLMFVN